MSIDDIRDMLLDLKEKIKTAKLMNDDRRRKLTYLTELMENVCLEEELTQSFFKDIRSGEAV